jgi:hypothetical protein
MPDERRTSPRGALGEFEFQAVQRLAGVEQRLLGLEDAVRERTLSTHAAIDGLGRKLEAHMANEEAERREWSRQLSGIEAQVKDLPDWRGDVERALHSLTVWRGFLTGAMAVVLIFLLPLVMKWIERTFLR